MNNSINFEQIAKDLIENLNNENLDAYIHHIAKTGSAYIKFKDERMGSIRIGDHDGRERYRYRFNLRSDISKRYVEEDRGIFRYYCPIHQINLLLVDIMKRRAVVDTW